MENIQKDILFDHFISGMEKERQATLRMMYLNSCNIDEANRRHPLRFFPCLCRGHILRRIPTHCL